MSVSHIKNITVADGTNSDMVRPSDWNSVHVQAVTLAGNVAGTTVVTGTNIVWNAGSNITLSGNGSTITIIGAGGSGTQSSLQFSNTNGVTFGVSGSTLSASVQTNYQSPGAYLTTAALSGDSTAYQTSVLSSKFLTTAALSGDSTAYQTSVLSSKFITTYVNDLTSGRAGLGTTIATTAGTDLKVTLNTDGLNISYPHFITTYAAQTAQPVAVSGSNGSFNFSTLQFVTGNGATFYTDATGIRISYTVPSVPAQTVQPVAVSGSNGSFNFSTLQFVTGNGASFYTDATGVRISYTVPTQSAQSAIQGVGVSNTGNTAGNVGYSTGINFALAGSGSITLSQSTAAGAATVWIQHPAWITTAALSGATSNYAGTGTSVATTTGSDIAITLNTTGLTVGYPKWLTTAALSANTSNYAGINTSVVTVAGTDMAISHNTSGVTLSYPKYLTTAALSANTSNYAGINTSVATVAGTDVAVAMNTSGITISYPKYITTGALSGDTTKYMQQWSLVGNVAGTSNSIQGSNIYFSGGNNVTLSGNSNTIVVSAAAAAPSPVNVTMNGVSGNLATIQFNNLNGVSFGLNGSTITASAAGGGGVAVYASDGSFSTGTVSLSALGGALTINTAASKIQFSVPATSSLIGTGGISLSSNGSTISISNASINAFEPLPLLQSGSTTAAPGAGTWYVQPVYIEQPLSGGRWNIMVAHGSTASILRESSANFVSNTTGSFSQTAFYERRLALYSIGVGTNSTRLESQWSNNFPLSFSRYIRIASGNTGAATQITISNGATISGICSIDSNGSTTQSTFGGSSTVYTAGSVSIGSTAVTTILSAARVFLSSQLMIPIPFNTTINPGQWYMAQMWTSSSGTSSTGAAMTTIGELMSVVNQYGIYGNTNTNARLWLQAATSGSQIFPGCGMYSAVSSAPPATMAFSDVRTVALGFIPYINYVNSTI
jgi:hypothetical protein